MRYASTMCDTATMHTNWIIQFVETAPGGFTRVENATICLTSTFSTNYLTHLIKVGV